MLIEIYCDKFKENGEIRPAIHFHKGLNTVEGTDSGTNSIGKSTFLMIIDYVFGGNDYINICDDVHKNIRTHVIKWKFQFGDDLFAFSRSTGNSNEVNICDGQYITTAQISIDAYRQLLAEKYNIPSAQSTFRDIAGLFFRVYGRPTLDEKYPLTMINREPLDKGVQRLLKIYSKYNEIG